MTMQIDIKNTSSNYIAKVIEMDVQNDAEDTVSNETILKPDESIQVYAWDTRYIKVEEIEEIKQQEPVNPPPNLPRQMG